MDNLEASFHNVSFFGVIKAQLRKYFDNAYKGHNINVDMRRELISPDELVIYRVMALKMLTTIYVIEKIYMNRKEKIYESRIENRMLTEICTYRSMENDTKVHYSQMFSVPFFYKNTKKELFWKGVDVLKGIIKNENLDLKV